MPQDPLSDEDKLSGRLHGPQEAPGAGEGLMMRLVFTILIAIMMSVAQTVLGVVTVVQFVIMALSKGAPNARLADFGTDLGVWMAKATRYMTAASEVKPWPWTELD